MGEPGGQESYSQRLHELYGDDGAECSPERMDSLFQSIQLRLLKSASCVNIAVNSAALGNVNTAATNISEIRTQEPEYPLKSAHTKMKAMAEFLKDEQKSEHEFNELVKVL